MLNTIYLILICCISLNAQMKDSLFVKNSSEDSFKFQYNNYTFFNKSREIDLHIGTDYINKPFFQVYNRSSLLNDEYINKNGEYFYVKSTFKPFYERKKDSFNPLGLSNDNTSFLIGVFSIFLDKVQK